MASGRDSYVAEKLTRRNSSLGGDNAAQSAWFGKLEGFSARRSERMAIRVRFSVRRCSCHTPRPINSATMISVKRARPNPPRLLAFVMAYFFGWIVLQRRCDGTGG